MTALRKSMMAYELGQQLQSLQIVHCSKYASTLLVAVVVVHQDLGAIGQALRLAPAEKQ